MTLTNLMTVLKTVQMTSVKLAVPADRIGLGFGPATAYSTDSLSQGRFPAPRNPEPEQLRSRQDRSATQMRKQTRTGGPGAVPPAGSAGCLPPGSTADRVLWSLTVGASRSVSTTSDGRTREPQVSARNRNGRDCQSPVRDNAKHDHLRQAAPTAAAGK